MNTHRIGNYAEVRVNGKRRLIQITSENDGRVSGYRVLCDGSRWDTDDGTTWTQEIVMVPASSVVRRMQLDLMYGELVEI